MKIADKKQLQEIELKAAAMLKKIRESESDYPKDRPTYYVDSENGCDEFDGKTPETAWRSTDKVGMADLKDGDVVLFRRGGVYRGTLLAVSGVTYSAYGEGPKPELLGSIDASDPSMWIPTPTKNVWRYKNQLGYVIDVGGIFFNDGSIYGIKITENFGKRERCDMGKISPLTVFNGRSTFQIERGPWPPAVELKDKGFSYFQSCVEGLKNDLEFYHSPHENYLYLYCADGNPARVFDRVELSLYGSISRPRSEENRHNVTYDNLAFKYCNFGIGGFGSATNLTVRNCEFIGIGGALAQPDRFKNKQHTPEDRDACRYGNGIEIYGVCDGMLVENCYFDQVYDAAVTVQYPIRCEMTRDYVIDNVRWVNNLFQRCNYPFELWLYSPEDTNGFYAAQRNIDISGNIAINTGFGWSNHRMDPNNTFYYAGWLGASNCDFVNVCCHDNILANGEATVMRGRGFNMEKGIKFFNNKIFHNNSLACCGEEMKFSDGKFKTFPNNDEVLEKLFESKTWDRSNEVYNIDKGENPAEPFIKLEVK